jgi:hypothetical protein
MNTKSAKDKEQGYNGGLGGKVLFLRYDDGGQCGAGTDGNPL